MDSLNRALLCHTMPGWGACDRTALHSASHAEPEVRGGELHAFVPTARAHGPQGSPFSGTECLGDEGLMALSRSCTRLTSLDLSCCTLVTNAGTYRTHWLSQCFSALAQHCRTRAPVRHYVRRHQRTRTRLQRNDRSKARRLPKHFA
jgi:hypothetical protein